MIFQPINEIFKEYYSGYENTVFHNSLEEYNKNNSGIYIDFKNNLIKLKNTNNSNKYCWLQITLPSINQFDEFYTEYEIRKCKGEPLKITIEKQHIYRQNAFNNTKTEWEKHCNKAIIEYDEAGAARALIGFGNTINVAFECEIRNIKIKIVSTKEDNYISLLKKIKEFKNDIKLVTFNKKAHRDIYYLGKNDDILNKWSNFVFFHFSNTITNLHNISCYDNKIAYSVTYLGKIDKNRHFKVYKKIIGKSVEFYLENIRSVLDNDTFVFKPNSNLIGEFPPKQINALPNGVEEIIPVEYHATNLASTNRHYNTFSVIGDSYSALKDTLSGTQFKSYYPYADVQNIEQMWWYKFANKYGSRMIKNNSSSGSTISFDAYASGLEDGKELSFVNRIKHEYIGYAELLLIYGGTNDEWCQTDTGRPDFLGEYKYSNFSESDFIYFRPALAYIFSELKKKYVGIKIVFILNYGMNKIRESVRTICEHYKVSLLELKGIALEGSHPNDAGMTSISEQLIEFLENNE